MHTCERCLLQDNIPTVHIDGSGVCNYCTGADGRQGTAVAEDEGIIALLDRYKNRKYQVIMAYSGGKDSTYTLKLMKEKYHASILAVTFNNGFLSDTSLRNISRVTDRLGVDSLVLKYPADKLLRLFKFVDSGTVFPPLTLVRASAICNMCILLIKNLIYHEAILREIPIICFGWTPGQTETAKPILRLAYPMVAKAFGHIKSALAVEFGQEYDGYFLDREFIERHEAQLPYLYYPFVTNAYCEEEILSDIQALGWTQPENTDGNSSNCLLNSFANQRHMERFGYHPYNFEISNMVRSGYMTKAAGEKKLENIRDDATFAQVLEQFQRV